MRNGAQNEHRVILRRGRDVFVDRQVSEERLDFPFAHLVGMGLAMEEDEPLAPLRIGILGATTVIRRPNDESARSSRFCGCWDRAVLWDVFSGRNWSG
jgi:hypothetical protein